MTQVRAAAAPDLVLDACGVVVAVRPPDAAARQRWERQWSRALSSRSPLDADTRLTVQPAPDGQPHEVADYALASRVTFAALEQTVGTRVSLHGAALADSAGRVMALVASSGTGKTTASRTLGRVLGYLSDETVSIGTDLSVLPYAKPLSVVIDPADPHRKEQLSPDELGLMVAPESSRLHRLVLLERGPVKGAGLGQLPLSDAVSRLVAQMSYVFSWKAPLLELTRLLLACGGVWRLRYTEITDHVDELVAFLDAPLDDTVEPAHVIHHPGATPAAGPPGTISRAPWHDAVEIDDDVVVLVGPTSFQLAGIGATAWLALVTHRTEADLLAIAEDIHGAHADSTRLLAEALASLEERGIIERSSAEGPARR